MKNPEMKLEDWNPEHVSKSSVQDNCALGCMRGELDKRIAELEGALREIADEERAFMSNPISKAGVTHRKAAIARKALEDG